MKLTDLLSPDNIIAELKSDTKEGVIEELAENIAQSRSKCDKNDIVTALLEREKLGSTGIENGIAIPHAKLSNLDQIIIGMGKSTEGVDFESHDGKPSHLFFVLLAPNSSAGIHLKTLARLSRLLKEDRVRSSLMNAKNKNEIFKIIKTEDDNLPC